jgi:uncharacterized repeat protein (TIGR03803 family)
MKTLLGLLATIALATSVFAQTGSSAPPITQLFDFSCNSNFSSCPQGFDPTLSPVQLTNGNFYGVTWWAGTGSSGNGGTVWKATSTGIVTALHTFQINSSGKFPAGENPVIAFAVGKDGNLYGATEQGGSANQGIMYRLTPTGSFKVLHNFCSETGCTDQGGPFILGQDGNFYGAVFDTIFQLTPQGVYTVIYSLDPTLGSFTRTLVQGSDGTFYGGGSGTQESGFIFSLTQNGVFTILHNFGDFVPLNSNIVLASNGNIYGSAGSQIFQLIPSSSQVTTIHTMTAAQGLSPSFLMQASDGNLWGLSQNGGISPDRPGTLFTLTTSGTFISSEEFTCGTTGCNPTGMAEGRDGNFYGNAITGGSAPTRNPGGTFFKVAARLK